MESKRHMIYLNALLAILLYLATPSMGLAFFVEDARNPTYRAGLASFNLHDYNTARRIWMRAAIAGNSSAQYRLGHLYRNGLGVRTNYVTARYWLQEAARNNHPRAQNDLGSLYLNGQGGPRDVRQALYWYKRSAAQGYPVAQYNAGVLLFAMRRYEEAIPFLEAAWRAGYRRAYFFLLRAQRALAARC